MSADEKQPKFWFYLVKTKYEWLYGWGRPARVEGWTVLFAYGFMALGGIFVESNWLILYYVSISAVYFAVLWLKGERPNEDREFS